MNIKTYAELKAMTNHELLVLLDQVEKHVEELAFNLMMSQEPALTEEWCEYLSSIEELLRSQL